MFRLIDFITFAIAIYGIVNVLLAAIHEVNGDIVYKIHKSKSIYSICMILVILCIKNIIAILF